MEIANEKKRNLSIEKLFLSDNHDWVVFVHGAGGSRHTWRKQIEAFRPHFNLLLLDLRDHGDSQNMVPPKDKKYDLQLMARDVVRVLMNEAIPRAHFIGVSMGSIVVRWVEKIAPNMVRSVVLAGGVFRLNRKMNLLLRAGLLASRVLPFQVLYRILAWIVLPRRNHSKSRSIFVRESRKIDPRAYLKWLGLVRTIGAELEGFFHRSIQAPTLAVMGSQDHVFLGPARDYAARFPEKTMLRVIEGVGHVCNIEAADIFNQMAVEFVKSNRQNQPTVFATAR
jgi:pimeloyl-ACP methyl ester carboxylesterase